MIYRFENCSLDTARMELSREGLPVYVQPNTLETLAFLIANRHKVTTKQEMIDQVWLGRIVSDAAIAKRIETVRRAIGDDGKDQRLIRTIYGIGFRFIGGVAEEAASSNPIAVNRHEAGLPERGDADSGSLIDWIGNRPKIAVAPLRLIGEAGPHATLAEALPADITHAIAKLPWLFVIARGSAFRIGWDEPSIDKARVSLGVDYVLAGTIEIAEDRFRCQIELVDTFTHGLLWTDRYECMVGEVHAVRQDIASRIVGALEVEIPQNEVSRLDLTMPESLTSWQSFHAGMSLLFGRGEQRFDRIHAFFNRSIELAPEFGLPWQNKAIAYLWQMLNQIDPDRNSDLMIDAIEKAQSLDPYDPGCLATAGFVSAVNAEPKRGTEYLNRALSQSPNMVRAYIARGAIEAHSGNPEQAILSADRAMALSPLDPVAYVNHSSRAAAFLRMGEVEKAADEAIRIETYGHQNLQASILALSALHVARRKAEADRVEERVRAMRGRISSTRMRKQYPEIDSTLAGTIFKTLMERNLQLA